MTAKQRCSSSAHVGSWRRSRCLVSWLATPSLLQRPAHWNSRRRSHQTAKGPKHCGSGGHSHGREGPQNSGSQGPSLAASAPENSINYKVFLLVYKTQHGLAPIELLEPYRPSRPLWSATDIHLLLVPMTRSTWRDRAFSKAVPVLWNVLPSSIRTAESVDCFKSSLKTYLFTRAFNWF